MQWLTVDGQSVPIVLPDHWDDDKKEWKTTGTGNPLPVANYTQNASGVWLPTSKDNPVPTQLTGSRVEYITDRKVLNSDVLNINFNVPFGTRGLMIGLRVHGVTGSFAPGEGINLIVYGRTVDGGWSIIDLPQTKKTTISNSNHLLVIYPGEISQPSPRDEAQIEVVNSIALTSYRVDISVSGSFAENEGFDCRLGVAWLA